MSDHEHEFLVFVIDEPGFFMSINQCHICGQPAPVEEYIPEEDNGS